MKTDLPSLEFTNLTVQHLEGVPIVARLLRELAERYIVPEFVPAARISFLSKNDEHAIARFVTDGFRYHIADIDGDGYLDLLVSTVNHGVRCYLNQRNGKFVETTQAAGTPLYR